VGSISRRRVVVIAACLAAVVGFAAPSSAGEPPPGEFPLALRVQMGGGFGAGWTQGDAIGPLGAVLAAEIAWRRRPDRAYVGLLEVAGGGCPCFATAGKIQEFAHALVGVGVERYAPDGPAGTYLQGAAGIAGVRFGDDRDDEPVRFGLGLSGHVGARLWAEPGPLGFVIGLRTSHVLTPQGTGHVLALTFGLTVHPR
jgi:hypothetical protein